jgi:hypothetical protein
LGETILLSKTFTKLFQNHTPSFGATENGAEVMQIGAWKSDSETLD